MAKQGKKLNAGDEAAPPFLEKGKAGMKKNIPSQMMVYDIDGKMFDYMEIKK
jgi:hypothetical protein